MNSYPKNHKCSYKPNKYTNQNKKLIIETRSFISGNVVITYKIKKIIYKLT